MWITRAGVAKKPGKTSVFINPQNVDNLWIRVDNLWITSLWRLDLPSGRPHWNGAFRIFRQAGAFQKFSTSNPQRIHKLSTELSTLVFSLLRYYNLDKLVVSICIVVY